MRHAYRVTEEPSPQEWQPLPAWQPPSPWQAPPAWQAPPPASHAPPAADFAVPSADFAVPATRPGPAGLSASFDLRSAAPPTPARSVPALPFQYEPPRPPGAPSWVGPVFALGLVLLLACSGLVFASCELLGSHDASPVAVGSVRPVASSPDAPYGAAGGGVASGGAASPTGAAPPPFAGGPSPVPAGSAAVPVGPTHVVAWPDNLQAFVDRVRVEDLPDSQRAAHPSDVAVVVAVFMPNGSPADITIREDRLRLWYGDDRRPAEEFVDATMGGGIDNTIRPGSEGYGTFAFAVPPQDATKLEIELVPRPGDPAARFIGSVH